MTIGGGWHIGRYRPNIVTLREESTALPYMGITDIHFQLSTFNFQFTSIYPRGRILKQKRTPSCEGVRNAM